MIDPRPFSNNEALAVFRNLDANDLREAQLSRGGAVEPMDLFCDWKAAQPLCALSLVLRTRHRQPFGLLAVAMVPGAAGQAQAAFLARHHRRFRRELVECVRAIRAGLPGWAAEFGLHRIEARSWAGHPTASRFLTGCGFRREATLAGFGPDGRATFHQFAWTRLQETGHVQDAQD